MTQSFRKWPLFVALGLLLTLPVASLAGKDLRLTMNDREQAGDMNASVLASDQETDPMSTGQCGCADPSCGGCKDCSGGCNDDLCFAYADPCPKYGLTATLGVGSWRGVSDGMTNNNGAFTGLNLGVPVPLISEWGFGWQIGGTFGIYDWMGRATNGGLNDNQGQEQEFITTGLFRRANEDSPWSGGIVYDWMVNNNFGTVAQDPFLGQWRAQLGYALSGRSEIGVWGCWSDRSSTRNFLSITSLPIEYQSIGQINAYWHHKLSECGADTWLWMGVPSHSRLNPAFGGVLHDMTFGAAAEVPMTDRLALSANFQYAKAAASQGVVGSLEDAYHVSVGFVFYPGRTARSSTVAGRTWMPLMPVANNGNFLVDRSL